MKNINFMKCTVLVILFLVLSTSLYAASSSLVIDECGTIDTDQKASLQVLANQIEEEFEVAAYVVLVNDPDMINVEDYAEAYYTHNGFGWGEEKTGIMLLLNFYERDYDICCYGSLAHKIFTDNTKSKIAKDFIPFFRNNEWYDGCAQFLISTRTILSNYTKRNAPKTENRTSQTGFASYVDIEILVNALLIGFGLSLIIALISCLVMKSKMKSVKQAKRADKYIVSNTIKITLRNDMFTHNTTVVHDIPEPQSNKTTISAGGFSHSSGKF